MNILLAGGSGFVGQHLYRRLTDRGHNVRIFDKKFPKNGPGYLADIKDLPALVDYMKGADVVYHLASNPDISKAATDPTIDFVEGTALTQNVLEAMRFTGVKRLVYFSGSGVYGENANIRFTEDHGPLLPISTYGASKLAGEALICAYCHMFGMEARAFRFANLVGAGQTHGVGFDFIRNLFADPTQLRILGDGTQRKSYLHIEDAMDAIEVAVQGSKLPFDVFNVATEDSMTVSEIAALARQTMGLDPVQLHYTGGNRGWKGDVPQITLDTSKIRSLGWANKMSSAEALAQSMTAMKNDIHDFASQS